MDNSLKNIGINNFKSIMELKVDLAPITIVCGTNSCGKSSLLKSILLLKQASECNDINDHIPFNGDYVQLGGFKSTVTRGEKDMVFQFELPFGQYFLGQNGIRMSYKGLNREDREYLSKLHKSTAIFTYVISDDKNGNPIIVECMIEIVIYKDSNKNNPKFCIAQMHPELKQMLYERNLVYAKGYAENEYEEELIKNGLPLGDPCYTFEDFIDQCDALDSLGICSNELFKNKSFIDTKKYIDSDDYHFMGVGDYDLSFIHATDFFKMFKNMINEKLRTDNDKYNVYSIDFEGILPKKVRESGMGNLNIANFNNRDTYRKYDLEDFIDYLIETFARVLRKEFDQIKYIGPLRYEPSRYYYCNDNKRDVGIKGENTIELLNRLCSKSIYKNFLVNDNGELVKNSSDDEYFWSVQEASDAACKALGFPPIKAINNTLMCGEDTVTDVGFGISQVYPIIIESLIMEYESTLILEQPELHLHPAMQMQLADFILTQALDSKRFIIETHSEHVINRLVRRIIEDGLNGERQNIKDAIAIYFVERDKDGHAKFKKVDVDEDKGIVDWPKGFFDQEMNENEEMFNAMFKKMQLKNT